MLEQIEVVAVALAGGNRPEQDPLRRSWWSTAADFEAYCTWWDTWIVELYMLVEREAGMPSCRSSGPAAADTRAGGAVGLACRACNRQSAAVAAVDLDPHQEHIPEAIRVECSAFLVCPRRTRHEKGQTEPSKAASDEARLAGLGDPDGKGPG